MAQNPDPALFNPYSLIPVDPDTHPTVNFEGAGLLANWLTREDVQKWIGEFGIETYGLPLFLPNADTN